MPKKKQTKARNMFTVAPGGERAQDEPMTDDCYCTHPTRCICAEPEPPKAERCNYSGMDVCDCFQCGIDSPPKAEQEPPQGWKLPVSYNAAARQLQDATGMGLDHWRDIDENGYAVADAINRYCSQPKADTGTLEARLTQVLGVFETRTNLDIRTITNEANALTRDVLRDALTELRRRQEELDAERSIVDTIIDHLDRHCRALHHQATTRKNVADLVDAVLVTDSRHVQEKQQAEAALARAQREARASSPDRRALVEKCREKERAYARAAAHHNDPQVGFANICKWFADELEASLTGTGKP